MLEEGIASDIMKEDLVFPDGTIIPREEIDWSNMYKRYPDDYNEQADTERDLSEPIRNVLDKESKLD